MMNRTKNFSPKRWFQRPICTGGILLLCLLAGCKQTTEAAEQSPVLIYSTPAPSPIDTEENDIRDTYTEERTEISGIGDDNKLLVDWSDGLQTSYQVISWTLYDSWADAGVAESDVPLTVGASYELGVFEKVASEPPVGGGILMVDIEVAKLSGERSESRMDMIALASAEMSETVQDEESEANIYHLSDGWYFNLGSIQEDMDSLDAQEAYWSYELPSEGENMVVTLGYIVDEQTRQTAERGELVLIFPDNPSGTASYKNGTKYLSLEVGN